MLVVPVQLTFVEGQISICLIALLAGALVALERKRDGLVGGLIGTAAILKVFPLILLLCPLRQKRWKVVWGATSVAAVALGLEVLLTGGLSYWSAYFQGIFGESAIYGFDRFKEFNFALTNIFPASTIYSTVIVLGMIATIVWHSKTKTTRGDFIALLLLSLFASPVFWPHYFIFPLFACAWMVIDLWPNRYQAVGRFRFFVLALVVFEFFENYYLWAVDAHPTLAIALRPVPAILLVVLAVMALNLNGAVESSRDS
jgi:hypothetical protein